MSLLLIPVSVSADITEHFCGPTTYLLDCTKYNSSGVYQNVDLGDGTTGTLYLTIGAPSTPATIEDSIALGGTYLFGCQRISATTIGTATYTDALANISGCDSIVTLVLQVYKPVCDTQKVVYHRTICAGELPCTWLGHTFDTAATIVDTLRSSTDCDSIVTLTLDVNQPSEYAFADSIALGGTYLFGCRTIKLDALGDTICTDTLKNSADCDSIVTLTLHTYKATPFVEDTLFATTCEGTPYRWERNHKDYTADSLYHDTLPGAVRDTVISLRLTVNHVQYINMATTICAGDSVEFLGKWYKEYKNYTDTTKSLVTDCDSIIGKLQLTVTPDPDVIQEDTTICSSALPYHWYGIEMSTAGDTTLIKTNMAGCDSVVMTLHLLVDTCAATIDTTTSESVCSGTEYRGRLTSRTITEPTSWTDSVRVEVTKNNFVDSLYHYTITPYLLTLPVIPEDSIIVYCGRAIDITKANDMVQGHIAALGGLYAPNAVVTWQLSDNNAWRDLPDTTAIRGGVQTVSVRCTITSDCGQKDTTLTLPVVTPSPENDTTMDDVEAGSLYGNRLLLVNKHVIDSIYGWDIQPEHVVWYQMKGAEPNVAADDSVHTGLYYTTDKAFEGSYYARIKHISTIASDCGGTLRTVILRCQKQSNVAAPQLTPTIARPAEQIRLFNLNAESVTEIRVYNTAGELQSTYTSAEATEFLFLAAHSAGYYLVDVLTEDSKVTLRYIVK